MVNQILVLSFVLGIIDASPTNASVEIMVSGDLLLLASSGYSGPHAAAVPSNTPGNIALEPQGIPSHGHIHLVGRLVSPRDNPFLPPKRQNPHH